MIDHVRLVGDQDRCDADRQIIGDPVHRLLDVAAQRQDVAALAHRDAETDRRLAVHAEQGLRRVGEAATDFGDVAQTDHAPVRDEIDVAKVLFGFKRTGDAQQQLLVARLDRAGGADHVLRLQCGDQRGPVDAEAGELLHRELDKDPLVLRTEHLDLGNVGDQQQPRTNLIDVVAQFALGEPIRGEAVDDPEGIAELVVEARTDNAGRQRMPHVADALADMVPNVRNLAGRCFTLQVDEDGRQARACVAAQEVEARRFLQRALDALGDLEKRVIDRGARPGGLNDHRLDDESRVLVAAKPRVSGDPGKNRRDHHIDDERAVAERPLR